MANNAGKGGGARKIGSNKASCKIYAASGRLERNKKRNKARAERQKTKAANRRVDRLLKGKSVHKRKVVVVA